MSSKKNKKQPVGAEKPVAHGSFAGNNAATAPTEDNAAGLKEETLRWIFAILGSLIIYWVVAALIQRVYHPDIKAMIKLADEVSFSGGARPEPVESLLFRAGVVTFALGILGFYFIFNKTDVVKKLASGSFFTPFGSMCVAAIIGMMYFDFSADNPFAAGGPEQAQNSRDLIASKTNFAFYFDGIFLGNYLLLYTVILVPLLLCIFYIGIKKYRWETNPTFNKVVTGVAYTVLGGTVLAITSTSTFEFPYSFENKYDFNSVFYSMTQVYAGVPMLVNGFTNTYGLYPQFLNPIFQVVGLSILKFSFIMSVLLGVSFLLNFLFLRKYVQNKVIWFFGCCSIIFFPYLNNRIVTGYDSFFAFYPIRYIIPSVLVFPAALYLNKRSQVIYWSVMISMSFFVLWNPEIGMVSFLSWLAFNSYNDFYTPDGKIAWKKMLLHWVFGAASIAVAFGVYKVVIFACYGTWPDLGLLFTFISHIGALGFNLLPMVLVHPWNVIVLIIILGFTYAITSWYKKEITPKASIIFLVSVISLGTFVYFQGRSHNWTLSTSSGFSFFLLTLLGDELWQKIKDKGMSILPLHLLFGLFVFVIAISGFELVYSSKRLSELMSQEEYKEKGEAEQKQINSNQDYILAHSHEKEKIYVFTAMQYQNLYFQGKRRSAFNPGQMDLSLNSDLVKWEREIIDSSFTAFIEPSVSNFGFYARPFAAYAACYEVTGVNTSMYMLNKRKMRLPAQSFFTAGDDVVMHKKYTDDTASITARIVDGVRAKPSTINTSFSVELLFYPSMQMYNYATLVGNMADSSGFVIGNIINTPNYLFGINGRGVGVKVAEHQWVYCVMNVYPDHFEVYQNGTLSGTFPLATPMRQSTQNLQVGNGGLFRNYIGAIAEVEVHNKPIDKGQVEHTWSEIQQGITK